MAETYDVAISSPSPNYDFFAHRMMELCGQMGLTFFYVNDTWAEDFLAKVTAGEITVRVLIDLTADQLNQDSLYTKLAKEIARQNGYVLDDPEVTAMVADKAGLHDLLLDNIVPVPDSVIIPRQDIESFELTDKILARLGTPFVVKPAQGGIGVVVNATTRGDILRSAELAPHADTFLLQQQMRPQELNQHRGWFRVYYVLDEIIMCWWNQTEHEYRLVSPGQVREHKLNAVKRIVQSIAQATHMKKFSCTVCLHEDGRFYAVDYVNPDPDMTPRSYYDNGVPDEVVRHIVWLLFSDAMRVVKHGQGFLDEDLAEAESGWFDQRRAEQMAEEALELEGGHHV